VPLRFSFRASGLVGRAHQSCATSERMKPWSQRAPAPDDEQAIQLTLPDAARTLSDDQWLDLLIRSTSSPLVDGIRFPGFPSEELQTRFVGSSNETALREASAFYKLVKKSARKAGNPLRRESRVLDFGCGWGRFLRLLWKDVDETNLYGCDVSQSVVDLCRDLNVPGRIDQIDPRGSLPYPDSHFDTLIAYSVFTHLPEHIHIHWMRELARTARPGCIFCLTLESRRFIDFVRSVPEDAPQEWHRMLAVHKARVPEFYRAYDSGQLVFMPTNEGFEETYGDAAVPLSFIERTWSPYFKVLNYIDRPRKFWQAVLVVRRS
jgi:SAM-dependent methyltransferase